MRFSRFSVGFAGHGCVSMLYEVFRLYNRRFDKRQVEFLRRFRILGNLRRCTRERRAAHFQLSHRGSQNLDQLPCVASPNTIGSQPQIARGTARSVVSSCLISASLEFFGPRLSTASRLTQVALKESKPLSSGTSGQSGGCIPGTRGWRVKGLLCESPATTHL